ncbi:MAG: carboxypeptidase regulatory-like domain-containing protein [Candidatus Binatota bacterium]
MKRKVVLTAFLSAVLLVFPLSSLLAYEGGAVGGGGTISGVVKFKGAAPAPKKLEVTKDKEVCAKTAKSDPGLIVSGGNLVNAVVSITDIKKGKKLEPQKVTLDQNGCEYKPHVLAFVAGSTVEILNPDGILHNVHSYSKVNSPFNIAQPKFKKTITQKIDKPEVIKLQCDVHGWMSGWFFVAENPYFSVTDNSGSFKLTDVPPGTYNLEVWHETLGKVSQKVTVKAKEEAKVTFELAKK